jgi:hypothetical protein
VNIDFTFCIDYIFYEERGIMRTKLLLIVLAFLCFSVYAQQLKEESVVINVEVPVRVYDGHSFIDNLTLDDFEVFEDGVLQEISAVYLIRGRSIERSEGSKKNSPMTRRHFFLFFEISRYSPMVGDAIQHFINNVLLPDDFLTIVTPLKDYRMKSQALAGMPKANLIEQLQGLLRRDVFQGYSEYWTLIDNLEEIAQTLSLNVKGSGVGTGRLVDSISGQGFPVEEKLMNYSNILKRIENLRKVDERELMDFAKYLKDKKGQKYVYLFYEREYIPQIEPDSLDEYRKIFSGRPDLLHVISDLFEFYKREILFDVDGVKQAYADASIAIQFLFIPTPLKHVHGVWFQEHSEDIYSAFAEMARATGGYVESSANPFLSFKHAVMAAENYYLLYYSPLNYTPDGKFKEIKIKVKNKSYRVNNRAGYFAN